jgi:hypothetical protein
MKSLFIILFLLIALHSQAQYFGGNNDGFSSFTNSLQNTIPDINRGGNNDGFTSLSIANQNTFSNIFTGGTNDGFALASINNQNAITNIFTGGTNDGFALASLTNQNPTASIYTGGNNDGFQLASVINQNPIANIFTGGSNDGFQLASVINQNGLINIFTGGINDGFATALVLNQNSSAPLSIQLISFGGAWQSNDALLSWRTMNEKNVDHFELERSLDGISFEEIGLVKANGNGSKESTYQYLDFSAMDLPGSFVFYRLKTVNLAGDFEYSGIVRLSKKLSEPTLVIYPNPTRGQFTLLASNGNMLNNTEYLLSSLNGSLIQKGSLSNVKTEFDLGEKAAGTYILTIFKEGMPLQQFSIILTR